MMLNLTPLFGLTLAVAAGVPPQEVQSVVAGNNQFALDLYTQMSGRDGNLFFSPYAIDKALAMTYAGARGDTAAEMAAALHFTLGPDRQHHAFLEARKLLNRSGGAPGVGIPLPGKRDVQLHLAASLWGQRGYGFQKNLLNLLQECYGAGLNEVDFTATEQARKTINAWVEKQTSHKIPQLFGPDVLGPSTRLVLASAIYFKGDWTHPFKKDKTRTELFRVDADNKFRVPMMNQTEPFGYCEDEQVQVLQMTYQGEHLAMVVLLPKKPDGLAELEKALTEEKLAAWVGQLREQKVDVSLPKFKLTDAFSLNETLAALGVKKAFSPAEADFSGMNGGREPLFLSTVLHKAFVDVNEEGTEAAAATGVEVSALALPGPAVPVFRADHPFVFAIRDVRTGMILFLGRVVKP
jgi:serpin B